MDKHPAVKLFLVFAAGILIGHALNIPVFFYAAAAAAAAISAMAVRQKAISGALGLSLLAVLGAGWYTARRQCAASPWEPGPRSGIVRVVSEPRQSGGSWSFTGLFEAEEGPGGGWRPASFKAAVRLPEGLGPKPEYGDRMAVSGIWRLAGPSRNPGGFDYREYLEHQEVAGIMSVRQSELMARGQGNAAMAGVIIPARRRVRSAVARMMEGDEAALLLGLMLGERVGLSQRVKDAFSNTGTTHVLAVSGLHVALVAFILFTILRVLRVPRRGAYVAAMAGLVFYAALTGGSPSIVRAVIMSCAVMTGMLFERQGSGLNMLGLSGLLILAFWPQALFSVGFQLSYAATFGILVMTRPIQGLLFRTTKHPMVRKWVLLPLAVSAAAQLGTAPLLAFHFHRIPLVSLAANLLVVPLASLVLALGLAMSLLSLFGKIAAAPMAASAYGAAWLLLRTAGIFDGLRAATLAWPRPDAAQAALYAAALSLLFAWRRLGRWRPAMIAGALLVANAMVWRPALAGAHPLEIYYIDVGQGDAAVVRFPSGRVLAIDAGQGGGGYDAGRMAVVPFLRYMGMSAIDRYLVTHADADHCGGLGSVLNAVAVRRLTTTRHFSDKPLYVKALIDAGSRGARVDSLSGYDTLDGIWPARGFIYSRPDTMENGNETSLVCCIFYGHRSFFFSGDMGPELEGHLLRQGLLPRCTVLKVPHHGARANNARGLAEAMRPEAAVISVGEFNRFGHPSPQALENYAGAGSMILRTDLSGAVRLTCDGEVCSMETMLGGPIKN